MQSKKTRAAQAAAAFFSTANSQDEFFLVEFDESARLSVAFTPDPELLYRRISHTRPFGRTSLYDAIHLALQSMKKAQNSRKALVLLTDGADNHSRRNFVQIRNELLESDVQLYAMGIFETPEIGKEESEDATEGARVLDELARESGGRHFRIDNVKDLPEASAQIGRELRSQYLLGYSPSNDTRDGKYRRVNVNLAVPEGTPPLRVYYRRGYHAPAE